MESEGRSSTASTVSGVYRNILQSPAPICMFYFSHPFGISSPAVNTNTAEQDNDSIINNKKTPNHNGSAAMHRGTRRYAAGGSAASNNRSSVTFVPWPRDTWRREYVVPPLVQLVARQRGTKVPDLESILNTIRQAWNTPTCRSVIHSRARDEDSSVSSWDISSVSTNEYKQKEMGSGTHAMISGPGLLRRRYSVPEIIMRKHSLSLQKSDDDETSAHSVPTPTSPRSPFVQSSGSDSNLTARGIFGGEISMRKSMLLRKIWSRDAQKRYDTRSGSWSPPLRRSQRRLTTAESVNAQNANKPCEVCSKLDEPVDVELEEKSPKRLRLTTSSSLVTTATNSPSSSSTIATTTPIKRQATTSTSPLAASPNSSSSSNGTSSVSSSRRQPTIVTQTTSKNVRIYMTPLDGSSTTDEHDVPQDVLRVEIEATHLPGDSSLSMTQSSSVSSLMVEHKNGNNAEVNDLQHGSIHTQLTADGNDIVDCFDTNCQNSSTTNENNINNNHLNNNNAKSDTIANIDQFISQLLIDNLNNIVSIVSVSQNESVDDSNNNSSASNRGIQLDEEGNEQVIVSQVYLSPERLNEIVHRGSTTSTMKIEEKSSSSTENAPSYLADTNISVYSSQLSDAEFQEIQKQGSPEILSVNTGSTYPICQNQEPCIVPRQTNLIRTESLEVQPSSASAGEDDAQESGENSEESGSEDSISLVDSLDDPISPRHHEKSQAFFVPITDLEGNDDPHAEALSTSMPDKLREKLARRQLRLEMKKEDERIRKQKKMQKVMDRTLLQEAASERRTSRQKVHQPKKEVTEIMRVSKVKSNNLLRTEVGLLETYTIDARGNVQMKPTSMKKETGAIKRTQIVRKSTQQKTASTNSNGKNVDESVHKKKDVQKMTLYQSQANLTPDVEGGPRRMYQKTEIHDGQKCIEILEIVECLDSSPDCSPTRQYGYNSAQKNLKSKIPIPVHKPVRAIAFQRTTGTSIGELSSHQGFVRAIQTPSHNKVDRMIADLLIEALNRQEDSAIEFVTTPKDVQVRRPVIGRRSTPKRSTPNTRYQQVFEVIPEEKSSFSVDSSSEEQQPHVAQIQSSNAFEELSVHSIDSTPINPREHSNVEHHSAVVQVIDVAPSLQEKKFYAGKAGIDEETPKAWLGFFKRHDGSPFESANEEEDDSSRSHGQYTTSTTESHSTQTASLQMTPQYSTITTSNLSSTISLETYQSHTATTTYTTATIASDLITPSSSCASENILTVIESPFNDVPRVNMATSPAPDTHDGLQIGNYLKDCLNKDTCTECNSDKSQDESGDKCKIKEVEPSKQKVIEKCNKQLNPKKSPEMTVKKSQNKDDGVKQKPKTISSHSKKTDDIRTKRTSQAVQKQVPTKINHALDSKSENNEFKCANGEEPNLKNVESKAKLMERNVWQIGEIKEPTVELNDDLPIDTSEIIKSEIDTTSFVIIPAPSNISEISANPTITKDTTADQQFTTPTKDRDKCTDCCFCNPQLHKMPEGPTSERSNCSFCKTARRLPDAVPTPDQFYQTMSKSDHTHIKTRSRDSDTVSVKCTKVNQKIRRLVSGGDKELSKSFDEKMEMKRENSRPNLTRPKNVNKIPTSKLDEPDDEAKIKTTKQTQQLPRIPSPYTILSSDKYDGTSSPCSSTSSCPASPKKGIAVLPVSRWQNQPPRQLSRRRPTRSQEHPVLDQKQNVENGNNGSKAGWSVTVAGNYHQDMAPDVEMRLCFPKSSQQHTSSHNEDAMQFKREFRHPNVSAFRQHLDDDLDVASARPIRALPPTQLHINPKKNLNRTVPDRSQTSSRRYNFPEVSTTSHIVTSRQTAKKAIKRVECSVAVTSATTKSFSNITRGQRAMSFQALNNSDHYKLSKTRQRDHSIDLGNLSSRRMSIESQTPSEAMTLTVMGNAIAPERKPRVPTQSERDVTRRHSSCFTRNRSVLS